LLIDRPPPLRIDLSLPPLTVVIACFNEETRIEETLEYVCMQAYPDLRILVADDGSTDRTAELVRARAERDKRISVVTFPHRGKARTLTAAVDLVETPVVATVDADTLLMEGALERIVCRLLISPPDTVAVAGAVFVRNSRRNFLTRAQEWITSSASPPSSASRGSSRGRWWPWVLQRLPGRVRARGRRLAGSDRRGHRRHLGHDAGGRAGRLRAHGDRLHRRPR
jgi:glycosyltransferase involved in cell wall biosynthesis